MYTYNHANNRLSRSDREVIIEAWDGFIRHQIKEGRDGYFINFMFNRIPMGAEGRMTTMIDQVERVHKILTQHIVKGNSASWRHLRPVFIGAPDLPVPKGIKVTSRSLNLNGGFHFNVVALTPLPAIPDMDIRLQNILFGKQSKLTVPLDVHFRERRRFYVNDLLERIHVTPITQGSMADYTLKTFKWGRVSSDAIQIWN